MNGVVSPVKAAAVTPPMMVNTAVKANERPAASSLPKPALSAVSAAGRDQCVDRDHRHQSGQGFLADRGSDEVAASQRGQAGPADPGGTEQPAQAIPNWALITW